ncbi:MAG: FUSC family protein [Gammaproteobacteria bacterium]
MNRNPIKTKVRHLLDATRAAPTRITLGFALRGSVGMMVPFLVLFELGRPAGGVFAALGGLYAVLSDAGGAYQRRLGAMLLALAVGAVSLFLGERMPALTWVAPLVLALIAFAAGMARAFGGSGISIGICASIMFLVGSFAPQDTVHAAQFAGYYAIGSLWVICFQLALWRLRPYRILLQQIAACYDACAELVETLATGPSGADPASARRRTHEHHQTVRAAIRAAETTLEAVRLGAGHATPFFDRMLMLLAAVSRESIAATGLRTVRWPAPGTPAARTWRELLTSWQTALAAVARLLLAGRGEIPVARMHAAFEALEAQGAIPAEARAPLRLALLHMDSIVEAGTQMFGLRFTWREALPRLGLGGVRSAWTTIAAQLTFDSIIFRHALRVAVAAGFGLWIAGAFHATHPLWLPMTTILVLQPEFGATWRRLWQRTGGTLAGVLIAGGVVFLVHGTVAELAAIAIFAWGTFFFIRSHYGIGVVMLTPMILLLLGVLLPSASSSLIVARGVDTIFGGLLGLAAAFLLWPLWQRSAFLPQCATAVRAERAYLAIAFALPGDGQLSHPELMQTRHQAERASDNADATLRRMLSEPRSERGDVRSALGFMTYLRRLADNAARFAVALGGGKLSTAEGSQGDEVLRRLDVVADALEGKASPKTLATIRPQIVSNAAPDDEALASWFERFAADTAMLATTARKLLHR